MTLIFTLLVLMLLTHGLAAFMVGRAHRNFVLGMMLAGWFCLVPILALTNAWLPFAGGGDDFDYYSLANENFGSFIDIFDIKNYSVNMAQPGYLWLLSIFNYFTGQDIFVYKLLNFSVYIMLIPLWYSIGLELGNRQFAEKMAIIMLLLSPLWFYWMFLLKDIIIVMLQSLFLLGTVRVLNHREKTGWIIVIASTIFVTIFRAQLVLVNVAVVSSAIVLFLLRNKQRRGSIGLIFVLVAVVVTILGISSNSELMSSMGIVDQERVLGSIENREAITQIGADSNIKNVMFPILYLFSETAGLSPQSWMDFDAAGLRGVMALPWIFMVVPFFVVGLSWLMGSDNHTTARGGVMVRFRSSRLVCTPWCGVIMFILIYMSVSWSVGDTTRWRLPDMPAMAAVALAGWLSLAPSFRMRMLLTWMQFCAAAALLFYVTR